MIFKEILKNSNRPPVYFDYNTVHDNTFWIFFESNRIAIHSYLGFGIHDFNFLTEQYKILGR